MKRLLLVLALVLVGCPAPTPPPVPDAAPVAPPASASSPAASAPAPDASVPGAIVPGKAATSASTLAVANDTDRPVFVFVSFGANSVVLPASTGWSFCKATAALNCSFGLGPKNKLEMPLGGKYLNATFSFEKPVGCETTKAEININNPQWYDVVDISLVDGWNKIVSIDGASKPIGPVLATGNEKAFGVYPNGCDICVARQSPPCGMKPGKDGCKGGTQYAPDVPCQYQGPTMGGGGAYTVRLLAGLPAVK